MQKKALMSLVKRMQAGDEQAFNDVYNEFYDPLYYIALEMTRNTADAKDIVQNTFIQIHHSIHTLQEPKVYVLWMKRILLSKCHNFYRARKNMIYDDETVRIGFENQTKADDVTHKEVQFLTNRQILHNLVKELSYPQQEVVVLHYFDQLKLREIADLLNISEGTVKSRMKAAKKSLRYVCEEYERANHEKVSMHSWSLGFMLSTMYASIAIPLSPWKKLKFQANSVITTVGSSVPLTAGVAVLTISTVVASPLIKQVFDTPASNNLRNESFQGKQSVEYEAYYKLRTWSHCIDEMKQESLASFQNMYPYYQVLKDAKGVCWEALQKDNWANDFEKIYTEKKQKGIF